MMDCNRVFFIHRMSSSTDKKRDDFPAKHRDSSSGYGSSSRSRDDSRSGSKRDYDSPKRDRRDNGDYKTRDSSYSKRNDMIDVPPRHSSSSSLGGSGSGNYNMGGRVVTNNPDMIIMKPYMDPPRSSSTDFRRSMQGSNMNNVTLIGGNANNGGATGLPAMIVKDDRSRYIDTGSQEMRYGGNDRGGGGGGMWQNNAVAVPLKPFGTVQIQNDDWAQDRYDRTYNERKSPSYMEPRNSSGGSGASFMNRPQDRYNSSRFDSGRFWRRI